MSARTARSHLERRPLTASRSGNRATSAIFAFDLADPHSAPRNLTPDADASFHLHGIGLWVAPALDGIVDLGAESAPYHSFL